MAKKLTSKVFVNICFIIFIATRILATTAIAAKSNLLNNTFKAIGILCLIYLLVIAYKKFEFSKQNNMLFLIIATTIIGVYVTHYSFMGLITPLLFIFIVPIIGFPKIVYLDFITRFCCVFTGILILGQFATKNVYNPITHFHKYGLGFGNPNALGMILLGLLMELVLVHSVFQRKSNMLIWLGVLPFLFATHCRTAIWSLAIFCITWIFVQRVNLYKFKWLQTIFVLAPFILFFVSLFFVLIYETHSDNAFVRSFDLFTSNRLKLSDFYFREYGLSFWGSNIVTGKYALDMGYISLLLKYGIFPTLVVLTLYSLTIKKFFNLKKKQFVPPIFVILIAMVPESLYTSIPYNPFMLCCGILLSQFNYVGNSWSIVHRRQLDWGEQTSQRSTLKKAIPINKWIIAWSALLAITLIHITPNVNNYIYGNNLKPVKITYRKSTFTKDFPYRYKKPEGIVVHETADKNISAEEEVQSFLKTWKKREAYVHAFVDKKHIIQIHPTDRGVWGAGKYANKRFIQVELCEENSLPDFAQSVLNDADYIAKLLHQYNLKPVLKTKENNGTIWSHDDVSKYLGNTNHTDPVGYFAKHDYSMEDFFELIKLRYYNSTPKVNYLSAKLPKIQQAIVLISITMLIVLYLVLSSKEGNKKPR